MNIRMSLKNALGAVVIGCLLITTPAMAMAVDITVDGSSWESDLQIDKVMGMLSGPERSLLAWEEFFAVIDKPPILPVWPLYKQQPPGAQGDFREAPPPTNPEPGQTTPDNPGWEIAPGIVIDIPPLPDGVVCTSPLPPDGFGILGSSSTGDPEFDR